MRILSKWLESKLAIIDAERATGVDKYARILTKESQRDTCRI